MNGAKMSDKKMTDEEYQTHMDGLAKKVGEALGGERIEEAIIACAACIGFGLLQLKPPHRDVVHLQAKKMIDTLIAMPQKPRS
jgi:hypothetical protein